MVGEMYSKEHLTEVYGKIESFSDDMLNPYAGEFAYWYSVVDPKGLIYTFRQMVDDWNSSLEKHELSYRKILELSKKKWTSITEHGSKYTSQELSELVKNDMALCLWARNRDPYYRHGICPMQTMLVDPEYSKKHGWTLPCGDGIINKFYAALEKEDMNEAMKWAGEFVWVIEKLEHKLHG